VWRLVDDVGHYTVNYYKCVPPFWIKHFPILQEKGVLLAQILLPVTHLSQMKSHGRSRWHFLPKRRNKFVLHFRLIRKIGKQFMDLLLCDKETGVPNK